MRTTTAPVFTRDNRCARGATVAALFRMAHNGHVVVTVSEFINTVKTMQCTEGECWVYPAPTQAHVTVHPEDWLEVGTKPRELRRFAYLWFTHSRPPIWGRGCGTEHCINPEHVGRKRGSP